jgi:hypothetical protein
MLVLVCKIIHEACLVYIRIYGKFERGREPLDSTLAEDIDKRQIQILELE